MVYMYLSNNPTNLSDVLCEICQHWQGMKGQASKPTQRKDKPVLGITLDELSPGRRSLSLFKSEKSSLTLGRGRQDLFSANFISAKHAKLEFKDQSVRSQISR